VSYSLHSGQFLLPIGVLNGYISSISHRNYLELFPCGFVYPDSSRVRRRGISFAMEVSKNKLRCRCIVLFCRLLALSDITAPIARVLFLIGHCIEISTITVFSAWKGAPKADKPGTSGPSGTANTLALDSSPQWKHQAHKQDTNLYCSSPADHSIPALWNLHLPTSSFVFL